MSGRRIETRDRRNTMAVILHTLRGDSEAAADLLNALTRDDFVGVMALLLQSSTLAFRTDYGEEAEQQAERMLMHWAAQDDRGLSS